MEDAKKQPLLLNFNQSGLCQSQTAYCFSEILLRRKLVEAHSEIISQRQKCLNVNAISRVCEAMTPNRNQRSRLKGPLSRYSACVVLIKSICFNQ